MNMIAELIPTDERLVIVEGIEELHIQHPRLIELSAGHPVLASHQVGKIKFSLIQERNRKE